MKKNEFVNQLSEYCEFENENFTLETLFKSIDGYDSLAVMSIIAFVIFNSVSMIAIVIGISFSNIIITII